MTPWMGSTYGHRTRSAMLVASMIVAGLGCAPEKPSQKVALKDLDVELDEVLELDDGEAIVARINGDEISREEFNRRLSGMADFARSRFQTDQRRRDFLARIIEFEILSGEAQRLQMGDHLEVRHAMSETMADLTLEEWISSEVRLTDVSDGDVEAYLEEHRQALSEPEELRLAELVVKEQERAEELASRFRQDHGAEEDRESAFRRFAFEYSQERNTGDEGGDLGWFKPEESPFGEQVKVEQWERGQLMGPLEFEEGFVLAMVIDRREAREPVLEEMEQLITAQIFEERRAKARQELVGDLTANADVEVWDERVEALEERAPEDDVPTSIQEIRREGEASESQEP